MLGWLVQKQTLKLDLGTQTLYACLVFWAWLLLQAKVMGLDCEINLTLHYPCIMDCRGILIRDLHSLQILLLQVTGFQLHRCV